MVSGKPLALVFSLLIAAVSAPGAMGIKVREGRPVVDGVYVNGHGPYRFLLDTGASINLMDPALARRIGMIATFDADLFSAAGRKQVSGRDENVVELGPVRAAGQRFLFPRMEVVHAVGSDIQGVLGQWFLSRFDYTLDLRGKSLDFGKQNRDGNRAQFRLQDGRASVATSLGELVLDSGVARLVLFGVDPDAGELRGLQTLTGSQIVGMVSSRLVIEGRDVWRGNAVAIPDRAEPGVAGLMPLSLFKTIYVCNSERYVVFD